MPDAINKIELTLEIAKDIMSCEKMRGVAISNNVLLLVLDTRITKQMKSEST